MSAKIETRMFHETLQEISKNPQNLVIHSGSDVSIIKTQKTQAVEEQFSICLAFIEQNIEKVNEKDFPAIQSLIANIQSNAASQKLQKKAGRVDALVKLHLEIIALIEHPHKIKGQVKFVSESSRLNQIVHLLNENAKTAKKLIKSDALVVDKIHQLSGKLSISKDQESLMLHDKITSLLETLRPQGTQGNNINKLSFCYQVAGAPKSSEELKANLELFLNNNHFCMSNDLSVYDLRKGPAPAGTDFHTVRNKLHHKMKLHPEAAIQVFCQQALALLIPKDVVEMGIFIDSHGDHNGAIISKLPAYIARGMPAIASKQMLLNPDHQEVIENIQMNKISVFVQEKGNFVIFLPKGDAPEKHGFAARSANDGLIEWNSSLQTIPPTPLNASENIGELLLEDTLDQGFYRIVYINGHGTYPGFLDKKVNQNDPGEIAGVHVPEFQKLLEVLHKKNTVFCSIASCFAGGTNSLDIHTKGGLIPFPLIIQSSGDLPTKMGEADKGIEMLDRANQMLFSKDQTAVPLKPKVLTPKMAASLARSTSHYHHEYFHIASIPLFIPEVKQSHLPYSAKSYGNPDLIVNMDRLQNELASRVLVKNINSRNSERVVLFLDHFIFNKTIVIPTSLEVKVRLASTGGNMHYYIDAIEAPTMSLRSLVNNTFYKDRRPGNYFPTKAYSVGKVSCKEGDLENVVIFDSPEFSWAVYRQKGSFYKVQNGRKKEIDQFEAFETIYLSFLYSAPLDDFVKRIRSGTLGIHDFYQAIETQFWGEADRNKALLYSLLLAPSNQPEHKEKELFLEALEAVGNETTLNEFCHYILRFLRVCYEANPEKAKIISGFIRTLPRSEVIKIIDHNPRLLAPMVYHNDLPFLRWYIVRGNIDLNIDGKHLIELAAHNNNNPMVSFFVTKGKIDISSDLGDRLLCISFETGNEKLSRWLMSNYAGVNSRVGNAFLAAAHSNPQLAAKLLEYVNPQLETPEGSNTVLHVIIDSLSTDLLKKALKLKNIDINHQNSEGNTPIMHALKSDRDDKEEVVLLLFEQSPNLFLDNNKGESALSLVNKYLPGTRTQQLISQSSASDKIRPSDWW